MTDAETPEAQAPSADETEEEPMSKSKQPGLRKRWRDAYVKATELGFDLGLLTAPRTGMEVLVLALIPTEDARANDLEYQITRMEEFLASPKAVEVSAGLKRAEELREQAAYALAEADRLDFAIGMAPQASAEGFMRLVTTAQRASSTDEWLSGAVAEQLDTADMLDRLLQRNRGREGQEG